MSCRNIKRQNNILNWDEIGESHPLHSRIVESKKALTEKNHSFFLDSLPASQHWRTYKEFPCCFLDIETTGLSKDFNDVTLVGVYDGTESKIFVKGKNLHEFPAELDKYQLIITFNGKCFDVPFLRRKFPGVDFDKLHIDLRYVLRELGFTGGLKRIERELGLNRDQEIQNVDGFEAVRLWHKYNYGNEEALRVLLKYNQADIENLKVLMDFAYEKMRERCFLERI